MCIALSDLESKHHTSRWISILNCFVFKRRVLLLYCSMSTIVCRSTEKAPNCTTIWPASNFLVEGIRYSAECNIYYRASEGIWPSTTWSGAGDFNQLTVNQSDTVLSGIGFEAQKIQDAGYFRMTTFFTESGFGGPDIAGNVPTFQNIYNTPTVFIRCEWTCNWFERSQEV